MTKPSSFPKLSRSPGKISPELLEWAAAESEAASKKGNLVLAMCHFGIMPHFENKNSIVSSYQSNFVVPDWEHVAGTLADAGTAAVFTGHFHGNDIASYTTESGNTIYDIQTAFIVFYPVCWRAIDITVTEEDDKTVYRINTDTKFIRTAEGLEPEYNGKTYDDLQSYSFDKYGINTTVAGNVVSYLTLEKLHDIKTFSDASYGTGLNGYLKKMLNFTDEGTVGKLAAGKVKELLGSLLPFEKLSL